MDTKSTKGTSSRSGPLFRYSSTYFLQLKFRSHCLIIILLTNDIFLQPKFRFYYSSTDDCLQQNIRSCCSFFVYTTTKVRLSLLHRSSTVDSFTTKILASPPRSILLISLSLSLPVCLSPFLSACLSVS